MKLKKKTNATVNLFIFSLISILSLFLIFLPDRVFSQPHELKEFQKDETITYSTKGHSKAKGLSVSIKYPKSWKAKEGERPNIVQKFSRAFDDGSSVMCFILIKDLPSEIKMFSDEKIAKEIFTEEIMKSMVSENSKLLEHQQTKYDGQPGAISSFVMVQERSGIQLYSYVLQHIFVYSKKMVSIQCMVGGPFSNNDKIDNLYKSYAPLFIQIGNSVILHDKWEQSPNANETEINFEEYWWLSLIISALLTWGIGLLPPVLIRFVFVKRPISKKVAIIIVSVFWFFNLMLFIALGSQSKTHLALFLVAVASYYILRKGHKKNNNKKSNRQ